MNRQRMTPIRALDERLLPCSKDEAWEVLSNIGSYPRWWPQSLGLRVLSLDQGLIGSALQLRPLGGRSFCCRVSSFEKPNRLSMQYFGGFIEGKGEWRLSESGNCTRVEYELDVHAVGRIVAWIGRVLPLGRIHSKQMQSLLRQLEKEILNQRAKG